MIEDKRQTADANTGRPTAQRIQTLLKHHWADVDNQTNCSGFLRLVASGLGITPSLKGNANQMIETISTSWTPIPTAAEAADEAAKGSFVVAVLKATEHADKIQKDGTKKKVEDGHVAVVVPGTPQSKPGPMGGEYAFVWCAGRPGQYGGQSDGMRTVGDVWRDVDRNKVHYFKCPKW